MARGIADVTKRLAESEHHEANGEGAPEDLWEAEAIADTYHKSRGSERSRIISTISAIFQQAKSETTVVNLLSCCVERVSTHGISGLLNGDLHQLFVEAEIATRRSLPELSRCLSDQLFLLVLLCATDESSVRKCKKGTFLGSILGRHMRAVMSDGQKRLLLMLMGGNDQVLDSFDSRDCLVRHIGFHSISGLLKSNARWPLLLDIMPRLLAGLFQEMDVESFIEEAAALIGCQMEQEMLDEGGLAPSKSENEMHLFIHLCRLAMRADVSFAVVEGPGEELRATDWSLKSNAKASRRRKADDAARALTSQFGGLAASSGRGFIFRLQIGVCIFLSVDDLVWCFERTGESVTSIGWSAAALLMFDRRVRLPPRSFREGEMVLNFICQQIECASDRSRHVLLTEYTAKWMDRIAEPLTRFRQADPPVEAMQRIIYPCIERFLSSIRAALEPATSYPLLRTALQLLLCLSNSLMKFGESGVTVGRELLLRGGDRNELPLVNCLLDAMLCSWDDLRAIAKSIALRHLSFVDIVGCLHFMGDGEDQADPVESACEWIMAHSRSGKARDYESAAVLFESLTRDIVTNKLADPQLSTIARCFSVESAPPQGHTWIRGIVKMIAEQIRDQPLPQVHGALSFLTIALRTSFDVGVREVLSCSFTRFLCDTLFENLICPLVARMLSVVALGENKVLLSKAAADDESFSFRVDCRGHLILAESPMSAADISSCADSLHETSLPHASSFNRFWISVKSCGDLVGELLARMHLCACSPPCGVFREGEQAAIVLEMMTLCLRTILGSRHPGLLEKWAVAVSAGVKRCVSNEPLRHIPTVMIKQLVATLLPSELYQLSQESCAPPPECLKPGNLRFEIDDCTLGTCLTLSELDRQNTRFPVVPPPLRKSASLCTALCALCDASIFPPSQDCPLLLEDRSGLVDGDELAMGLIDQFRLLSSLEEFPAEPSVVEAVAASKFHALNILRAFLQRSWHIIIAASRRFAGQKPTDVETGDQTDVYLLNLLPSITRALEKKSNDFRISSAQNLLSVTLHNVIYHANKLDGGRLSDYAGEMSERRQASEFYTPNCATIYRRSHHPLARDLEELFERCEALRSCGNSTLLSILTYLRPPFLSTEVMRAIFARQSLDETCAYHPRLLDALSREAVCGSDLYQRNTVAGLLCSASDPFLLSFESLATFVIPLLREISQARQTQASAHMMGMWMRGMLRRLGRRHRFEDTAMIDALSAAFRIFEARNDQLNLVEWLEVLDEILFWLRTNVDTISPDVIANLRKLYSEHQEQLEAQHGSFINVIFKSRIFLGIQIIRHRHRASSGLTKKVLSLALAESRSQVAEEIFARFSDYLEDLLEKSTGEGADDDAADDAESIAVLSELVKRSGSFTSPHLFQFARALSCLIRQRPVLFERLPMTTLLKQNELAQHGMESHRLIILDCFWRSEKITTDSLEALRHVLPMCLPHQDKVNRISAAMTVARAYKLLKSHGELHGSLEMMRCVLKYAPMLLTDECIAEIREPTRKSLLGGGNRTVADCAEWLNREMTDVMSLAEQIETIWCWLGGIVDGERSPVAFQSIIEQLEDCLQSKCGFTVSATGFAFDPDCYFEDEAANNLHMDVTLMRSLVQQLLAKVCVVDANDRLALCPNWDEVAHLKFVEFYTDMSRVEKWPGQCFKVRALFTDLAYPTWVALQLRQDVFTSLK